MPKSLKIRTSKFRFEGTRFTAFLRDEVTTIHNYALGHLLETLVDKVHNFTGETQATFRQFRDYLAKQNLDIQLKDFTQPEVLLYQYRFNKTWNIPAKIKNLPNAGSTTAYGQESIFKCTIDRAKFSIKVDFKSGSDAFNKNPDLKKVFEEAKAEYKEFFREGLRILFDKTTFTGKLKKYFNRVDIGG